MFKAFRISRLSLPIHLQLIYEFICSARILWPCSNSYRFPHISGQFNVNTACCIVINFLENSNHSLELIVSFRSKQKHFCSVSNSRITTDVISQLQQLIVASLLPIYTVRWFEAFEIPSSARNYDNSISCDSWMIRATSQLNFQMETLTYRLIWFEVTNWVRNWNSISQNIQNSLKIPSNWRHS